MNTDDNMLSIDPILNSNIVNKGFAILDATFKEKGWHLTKNELNWICYSKFSDETSCFDIKIFKKALSDGLAAVNISKIKLRELRKSLRAAGFFVN